MALAGTAGRGCVAAGEGGGHKHAETEDAGIGDLNANLGGAEIGIEDRADIADGPGERAVGIGIELDAGVLAEMDARQVVLVDVAEDPDAGEVGNGERRCRAGEGDAGGSSVGDVLRR